ncbi:WD40 repeat-like protein [Exidia glandulosa HHB12029]|uniref:WD40 repeat-like protein n=1 Tax=Exidia glandulosa HHB12029 TaxID=1314781 RepID=A0A165FZ56_EXIGL|nr:WD40 repeat-like protein [Exidia glandulosa HHB12029]
MSSKKGPKPPKPPKTRPQSTFNQPVAEGSTVRASLCAFSPAGDQFALVSLALDKHRLRVFDVSTARVVAEHTFDDGARVTCLAWAALPDEASPAKKRKKRSEAEASTLAAPGGLALALGLTSGALSLFSPAHGRIVRTLVHATSATALSAVTAAHGLLYTSSADGTLRSWNPSTGEQVASWKRPRSSCLLSARPGSTGELLECSNDARLVSFDDDDDGPEEVSTLAGHAANIVDVAWDQSRTRVVSCADGDRVVHVWELADSGEGVLLATMPLDADVLSVALSDDQALLAVSASDKAYVTPLPAKLSKKKTSSLEPQATVAIKLKGAGEGKIASAAFRPGQPGRICIVRIAGGARPVFDTVRYADEEGEYIADVQVAQSDAGLASLDESGMHPNKRYQEVPTLAVQSGLAPDADAPPVPDGHLDAQLAELSLGQRIGLSGGAAENDSDDDLTRALEGRRLQAYKVPKASGSLARTLVQALHAGDSQLLDTVLRHGGDQRIVQATVRRLPPQLAVPFLISVTERLARRKQDAAAASAQRGLSLLNWVRAVLVSHSAHLLTMPDLVARLAALHGTLTTRAAMHERLLTLNGRLELVLAQAALRGAPVTAEKKPKKDDPANAGTRYVEGESDEEPIEEVYIVCLRTELDYLPPVN